MKRVLNFKTIGLALLVSLFALNISAQGPGRGFQMTEEDIKENVDNTAKTLKLNDEQHKKALAVEMDRISERDESSAFFKRDADNIRNAVRR